MSVFGKSDKTPPPRPAGQKLTRREIAPLIAKNGWKVLSTKDVDGIPGEFQIGIATREGDREVEFEAMLTAEPLIKGPGHDDIARITVWIGFNHTKVTTLELINAFNQEGNRCTAILTQAGSVMSRISHYGLFSRDAAETVLIEDIVALANDALRFNKLHNAELTNRKSRN